MKNKLKKTFAAALAALTMTTAMAGTASAAEDMDWQIGYAYGGLYQTVDTSMKCFYPYGTTSTIRAKCTYYNSSSASNKTKLSSADESVAVFEPVYFTGVTTTGKGKLLDFSKTPGAGNYVYVKATASPLTTSIGSFYYTNGEIIKYYA